MLRCYYCCLSVPLAETLRRATAMFSLYSTGGSTRSERDHTPPANHPICISCLTSDVYIANFIARSDRLPAICTSLFFNTQTRKALAFVTVSIVTTAPPDGGGGGGSAEGDGSGASLAMGSIPSVRSSADASVETDRLFLCTFAAFVTTPSTSCSINMTITGVTGASTGRCGDVYVRKKTCVQRTRGVWVQNN